MESNESTLYLEKFIIDKKINCPKINYDQYEKFAKLLSQIVCFEAPDFYIKDGKTIWLLEHFEIDGSRHNKKGSENKLKQDNDQKKANEFFESHPEANIFSSSLNVKNTSKQYLDNLFSSFKKHYDKIEKYKSNIKKQLNLQDDVEFKIVFLIEDTTVFGTFYYDNGIHPLLPIKSAEFMNYMRGLKNIDGIICSTETIDNSHPYSYILLKNDFEENKQQETEFLKIKFETMNPHSIFGSIIISVK